MPNVERYAEKLSYDRDKAQQVAEYDAGGPARQIGVDWRGVSHLLGGRCPSIIAPTDSCAKPAWLSPPSVFSLYLFLPLWHRPSPQKETGRLPQFLANTTFHEAGFRGCVLAKDASTEKSSMQ